MAKCSFPTIGITIAILDFIGGLLGTFICSVLLESFWDNLGHAQVWSLATYCIRLLIDLESESTGGYEKNALFLMVLLYIFAVLSSLHIAFAPILLFGILKKRRTFVKLWQIFKLIALALSSLAFAFFIIKLSVPMIVAYGLFIVANALFLCGTRPLLGKIPRGGVVRDGSFLLEDATAPDGLLERFAKLVEGKGLEGVGLYRVPGNQTEVQSLFKRLSENPNIDFASFEYLEVQTLASAFKELMGKRLAPPPFPTDKLKEVEQIAQLEDNNNRSQEMKLFLSQLPAPNFDALKILFTHLAKVAAQSQANSMTSANLAICWWPTLLPINITDMTKFQQLEPLFKDLIQNMIDQNEYFFAGQDAMV